MVQSTVTLAEPAPPPAAAAGTFGLYFFQCHKFFYVFVFWMYSLLVSWFVGLLVVGGYQYVGFRKRPFDLAQQIPAVKYYCLQNHSHLCCTKKSNTFPRSLLHYAAFPKMQK